MSVHAGISGFYAAALCVGAEPARASRVRDFSNFKEIHTRQKSASRMPKDVPFGRFKESSRGKREILLETFLVTFFVTKK